MRSLLHDYLATDGDSTRLGRMQATEANVFQKTHRDKAKACGNKVFYFLEVLTNST